MNTVILLYYRAPYEDEPELICVCDSQDAVAKRIYQLHFMHPHAYPDMSRVETKPVEYYDGLVVTN